MHPAGELEQQLSGIEVLGAAAVQIAAEQRQLVRELVDELLLVAELGEQLLAVLPEVLGIGGHRVRHRGHRRVNPRHRANVPMRAPAPKKCAALVGRAHARADAVARTTGGRRQFDPIEQ